MKFRIQVLLVVIITMCSSAYAQELSKAEKKNLKKEIRTLLKDPVQYKMLKESIDLKETIVQEQAEELIGVTAENAKNVNSLNYAKDSINLCMAKIANLERDYDAIKSAGGIDDTGMKFKLQIGKYKEFDISNFLKKKKLMTFERDENGVFIYTIGNFETEYDAELFKSAMRQIILKDAFVAYYLDGVRIAKD
jgi:hypothetical protein